MSSKRPTFEVIVRELEALKSEEESNFFKKVDCHRMRTWMGHGGSTAERQWALRQLSTLTPCQLQTYEDELERFDAYVVIQVVEATEVISITAYDRLKRSMARAKYKLRLICANNRRFIDYWFRGQLTEHYL